QQFAACWRSSSGDIDLCGSSRVLTALAIYCHDHRLRPETIGNFTDELRPCDGRRVNADLVGAGIKDLGRVFQRTNSAANGKRNEKLLRRPADCIDQRLATTRSRRDVQQYNLICSRL